MKTKKVSGQILVILLLVLSILSIFMLAMATNSQKDTQETRENEKYEQFYSIAEQKLILAQEALGLKALNVNNVQQSLTSTAYSSYFPEVDCSGYEDGVQCTLEDLSYEINSSDRATANLYFSDKPELLLFQLKPNSNLKINLLKGVNNYDGVIELYWNTTGANPVYWIVTLDYYKAVGDDNVAQYKSIKISTLNPGAGFVNPNLGGGELEGITYSYGLSFSIQDIRAIASIGSADITTLRIKPVTLDSNSLISIGISPVSPDLFPSQFRKITAVVNSDPEVNTGITKSPTVILNLAYPVNMPINPLLDYVYRGGSWNQYWL